MAADYQESAFETLAGIGTALGGSWSPDIDNSLVSALRALARWAAETKADVTRAEPPKEG